MSGVPYEQTHPFWAARLSMTIALTLKRVQPKDARQDLKRTLDEYLASGVPSQELQKSLREEMR